MRIEIERLSSPIGDVVLAVHDDALCLIDFVDGDRDTRTHLAHPVEVTAGSRLRDALEHGSVPVNSMHHQAVKDLGEGLIASAVAPDGVIEAVEGRGPGFLVGVQWHPEMFEQHDPSTRHLFGSFVDAAAQRVMARVG